METRKGRCQQSYGLPSPTLGFSHALKNSPPDCFSPRLRRGRAFESHYPQVAMKKEALQKECFFFHGVDNGIRTHDLQSHNLTR